MQLAVDSSCNRGSENTWDLPTARMVSPIFALVLLEREQEETEVVR